MPQTYFKTYFNIDLKNFFKKEIRLKSITLKILIWVFKVKTEFLNFLIWIQEGNLLRFYDLDLYRLKIVKTI